MRKNEFPVKKTILISPSNSAYSNYSKYQISSQTKIHFVDHIFSFFPIFFRIQHTGISLNTKFYLKQIILVFGTNFAKTGYVRSITEKLNTTIKFIILKLGQMWNFILNKNFWLFPPHLSWKGRKKCAYRNQLLYSKIFQLPWDSLTKKSTKCLVDEGLLPDFLNIFLQ